MMSFFPTLAGSYPNCANPIRNRLTTDRADQVTLYYRDIPLNLSFVVRHVKASWCESQRCAHAFSDRLKIGCPQETAIAREHSELV